LHRLIVIRSGATRAPTAVAGYGGVSVRGMEGRLTTKGLKPGQGCAIAGIFFAGWAVWVLPYFFGPLGMIMGGISYARGERRGRWVVLIALAGMVLGLLFGLLPDKFAAN
jgi:hypothetical protein